MKFSHKTIVSVASRGVYSGTTLVVQYTGQKMIEQYVKKAFPNSILKPLSWFEVGKVNGRLAILAYWGHSPMIVNTATPENIP